ncbi:MAG: hypothetical protein QM572_10860 [Nocardioides sp.]|uniref:hypothetical protein n=1 Tax=Nocardioides sp. TaxID=35761 RepID=UPI0039E391FD
MESQPQPRGVFFDEDDARAAHARLVSGGWEAALGRERFQGEDDDEDHPWVVTTDAPDLVLELLVEEYDGWLDVPEPPASLPPLVLPTAPKRVKRPDLGPGLGSGE